MPCRPYRFPLGYPPLVTEGAAVSEGAGAKADVFCQIAAGALQAAMVARTPELIAFLDHRPVFKGHVLIAPVAHVDTLLDLPHNLMAPLLTLA
ncbi:MAG: HIT family protein, partial [Propionibacteriaceae bacterium]|nr:HIT family protein [Propionibacteriaceae bacterium]